MVEPACEVRRIEWVGNFFEQRLAEGEKSPRGNFLLYPPLYRVGGRKGLLPANVSYMNKSEGSRPNGIWYLELKRPLRFLSVKEISMIDDFLAAINDHGELRLVVHKGRLRFVTRTQDFDIPESGNEGG